MMKRAAGWTARGGGGGGHKRRCCGAGSSDESLSDGEGVLPARRAHGGPCEGCIFCEMCRGGDDVDLLDRPPPCGGCQNCGACCDCCEQPDCGGACGCGACGRAEAAAAAECLPGRRAHGDPCEGCSFYAICRGGDHFDGMHRLPLCGGCQNCGACCDCCEGA